MTYKKFYLYSMIGTILVSAYPIYMGIITLISYFQNGSVDAADYQKYIIPYTPICISLIAAAALMPLLFKLFKRYTLLIVSLLGMALFFASEFAFERITIIENSAEIPLESWQLSLCMATPEVLRSVGEPIFAANNPAFKIHFYIIAIVIILALLNVLYGFSKMLQLQDFSEKRPLIAQAVSVLIFVGMCIWACFTAFYRNGTINISALSAILMSGFFIVFGVTAGIYCSTIFPGAKVPAAVASLTTLVMYIGELLLMGGVLYSYGSGLFFKPLGIIPFSTVDLLIILASGVITYAAAIYINKGKGCDTR